MRRFTVTMASVSAAALVLSCSGGRGADGSDGNDGNDGSTCTVNRTDSGVVITCDDGTTETITDGATGTPGKNGADGENGATGNDGIDGQNGKNALVGLADEPIGGNCVYGGTRVTAGNDTNANKLLDDVEVTSTRYLCSGQPGATGTTGATGATGAGGKTSLVSTSTEPAGSHCAEGGIRVDVGLDDDANGTLESLEFDHTSYLCQAACVLENSKVTIAASVTGSLDYTSNTNSSENYLLASTGATTDIVGWMGFDLTVLSSERAIVSTTLFVRQLPQAGSPTGSPALRVVHGPATAFTRTGLATASMTRGKFVSDLVSNVAADAWKEIRLEIDSTTFGADRNNNRLSLGLDEVTTPTQTIHFYGADDPLTRPYLEFETLRCARPE